MLRSDREQSYDKDRVARLFDQPADARTVRRGLVGVEGTLPHRASELAFERLELAGDDVLLDVGTGRGRLAILAAPICRQVIGVDISRRSLADARVSAADRGLSNIVFAYGALENPCAEVDLASYRINKILAAYSLHHLPDTLKQSSLSRLAGLLRRPGRLAIADLMFFEDPARHEDDWDTVGYDGGEYDFPASVDLLTGTLTGLGAELQVERLHPLVGVITADLL
jgi:SAM-dependent methyltransferase